MDKLIRTIVLCFLFCAVQSHGATHDVCKSGCTDTDIQTAYNRASAGDVVEIQDSGTYNIDMDVTSISMDTNGTEENPITLQGEVGHYPVVSGSGSGASQLILISADWNILKNIHIDGSETNGIIITGDHNIIDSVELTDIDPLDDSNEGIYIQSASYNTVQNCTIHDCGHAALTIETFDTYAQASQYNQILNNYIDNSYGHGIGMATFDNYVVSYNLIEGNEIYDSGTNSSNNSKNAIQVSGLSQNNTIRKNIIADISIRGIEISAYHATGNQVTDNLIYNNTFYNISTNGTTTKASAFILWGNSGAATRTVTGNKFFNNIGDKVGQSRHSDWTDHTGTVMLFYYVVEQDLGDNLTELGTTYDWRDNHMLNNIIRPYFSGAYQLTYGYAVQYSNAGLAYQPEWTIANINGVGSHADNITSDPEMASTDTSTDNWWYISSDSPAVDAGVVVSDTNASTGGWSQLTYNGTAPDIGAYEYDAGESTTGTITSGTTWQMGAGTTGSIGE